VIPVGKKTVNRSAITGRFVTKQTMERHPKTTVVQTVRSKRGK
jgi:hypothetical protein